MLTIYLKVFWKANMFRLITILRPTKMAHKMRLKPEKYHQCPRITHLPGKNSPPPSSGQGLYDFSNFWGILFLSWLVAYKTNVEKQGRNVM